jgi:hypothetical protein
MNVELLFRLHLAGPHGLPVRAAGEEPGSSVNGRCAVANKRQDTRGIRGWLGHVDHEHGRLFGAAAEPFQGLLARLMRRAAAARVGTYLRA